MDDARQRAGSIARHCLLCLALSAAFGVGCMTPYIGTTASSFLRRVRESSDPNIRYLAYSKLASPNCYDYPAQRQEAAELLIKNLLSDREPTATRAVICRTLGELREPVARAAMLQAINDPDPFVQAEACRALGKVGRPEDATVLARLMVAATQGDCRIAAIDGLGELHADDPRINTLLVQGMEHDDPAIRLASLQALRKITQKDLGVEPGPWRKLVREEAEKHDARPVQAEGKTDKKKQRG